MHTLYYTVQEHKKRIAEELNTLKLAEEEQQGDNVDNSTEEFLSPAHADDGHEEQCNPPQDGDTTAIYQMLNGGIITIIFCMEYLASIVPRPY